MKNLPVILIFLAMAASCSRSSINERELFANADTITVDFDNPTIYEWSSFVDSISFLKLQTTDKSIIGQIDDILFMDSAIVIVDKRIAQAVFLFDYNGRYKTKLSHMGNGPKEYLNLTYVFKMSDSVVAIQDRKKRKVMCFNANDGSFLNEFDLPQFGGDIEYVGDNTFVHEVWGVGRIDRSTKGEYAYVVSDNNYNVKYGVGIDTYSKNNNYGQGKYLYRYNDTIYGIPNFEKIVYQFTPDGVKVKYLLDIVSDDVMDFKYNSVEEIFKLEKQYPFFMGEFIEMDNYSIFRIAQKRYGKCAFAIYDHKTKITYMLGGPHNHPFMTFLYKPYLTDFGNSFATSATPVELLICKDYFYKNSGPMKDLDALYNDMKVDDNPVLFFYHLKDKIAE